MNCKEMELVWELFRFVIKIASYKPAAEEHPRGAFTEGSKHSGGTRKPPSVVEVARSDSNLLK